MNALIPMIVLAVVAALWLARPWLSRFLPETLRRRNANVAIYKNRMAELNADVSSGLCDETTAEFLRAEAANRLLGDAQTPDDTIEERGKRRVVAGLILALLPVLAAGGWYWTNGSWRVQQEIDAGHLSAASIKAERGRIKALVVRLTDRMKKNPNDPNGWALLGRSQYMLGEFKQSANAYAQANQYSSESNPNWLVAQGEAEALAAGHDLSGEPTRLFDLALKIAPDNPRALWFAGLAAAQRRDTTTATVLWSKLAAQPNTPPKVRKALMHEIARIGGGSAESADTGANSKPAAKTQEKLLVTVRVSPGLAKTIPSGATLFVFAKAASGMPMPLAVARMPADHFPVTVTLDDSMSPMPTAKLSSVSRWNVTARISGSGQALPASGDLQGMVSVSRSSDVTKATVVIDKRVP